MSIGQKCSQSNKLQPEATLLARYIITIPYVCSQVQQVYSGFNYIANYYLFFSKNPIRNLKVPLLPFKTLFEFFRYLFFSWRYRLMKNCDSEYNLTEKKVRPGSRRNNALLCPDRTSELLHHLRFFKLLNLKVQNTPFFAILGVILYTVSKI